MIQLYVVFFIIMLLLQIKKPLWLAMAAGTLVTVLLYGVPWHTAWGLVFQGIFQMDTLELILAFYGINLLQKAMVIAEQRDPHNVVCCLFSDKRKDIMVMPFLMGLLPTAGAVRLAAPLVDKLSESYLTKEEETFVTSYYRHLSESFLPTYSYIILAVKLARVSMGSLQVALMPMVVLLFLLGYLFYVRKIPHDRQDKVPAGAGTRFIKLARKYWAIILLVAVIIWGDVPIYQAIFPVVALYLFVNRLQFSEIREIAISSLEPPIMLSTIAVMAFQEVLFHTSVNTLPQALMSLPIPPLLTFTLLFLLGSWALGSYPIFSLGIPLASAAFPNGGIGILVLAIGTSFLSSQMSPTHICLSMAAEYFHCTFWDLLRKTLPVALIYISAIILYSGILLFSF